ncbi:MAG: SGNH/GDSL hydrolase family protein, partial [Pirellulales bacterium]
WLETYLHARFPQHELVVRNLGYSGDELELSKRLRSRDFGTPDQWLSGSAPIPQKAKLNADAPVRENRFELTDTKADVILACFGYNESFAGAAGLDAFKKSLGGFIEYTLAQKYNGKSAPRLVLISPIAHENLGSPNLPDGAANNERLKLYVAVMKEVAQSREVPFVDLFTPTLNRSQLGSTVKLLERIEKTDKRRNEPDFVSDSSSTLTINGIHQTELGDDVVARLIMKSLFGELPESGGSASLEKLRSAVNDKNFYWFHRYRTTDGYSTYGDRAFLKFVGGQTNYEVGQRELEVLDLMTSNRDRRVWAAARGQDLAVKDDNLPSFVPVKTNKPGPLEGGLHAFLKAEAAIEKMT